MEKLIELLKKWNKITLDCYTFDDFRETDEGHEATKEYEIKCIKYQNQTDEHRWYIIDSNVYEIILDGEKYYFGIDEVGSLKSESMSRSDTCCEIYFYPIETYVTIGYRRVKEG